MIKLKLLLGTLAGVALIACQPAGDMGGEMAAEQTAAPVETAMPEPAAPPAQDSETVAHSLVYDTTWVNLFAGHDLSQFVEVGGADWNIVDDYVESTSGTATGFLVTRGAYGDVQLQLEFWTSPDANSLSLIHI